MALQAVMLSCGYNKSPIVSNVNLSVSPGDFVCLLGSNGVGKTTLFKTLLGLLKPVSGSVVLDGRRMETITSKQRARMLGYVPQSSELFFPYRAEEIVMMGRSPWIGSCGSPKEIDYEIVDDAFSQLSIRHLKQKSFMKLSSGEKQLVIIARALAQKPGYLIMDEPTSNLDFGNQIYVLSEIKRLSGSGIGILMTTHHPNHVFETGGRVILIDRNRKLHSGSASEIMTETLLKSVYGVEISVATHHYEAGRQMKYCLHLEKQMEVS
jgi:iron complex transport system ATP-binding protein